MSIWTVLTKCIGLILRHWDTKSIGSLLQGLHIFTVWIFKPDFSLLWLLVPSSGNIHLSDSESLNGTFPPRLAFKHYNVSSQSTFWQGKQNSVNLPLEGISSSPWIILVFSFYISSNFSLSSEQIHFGIEYWSPSAMGEVPLALCLKSAEGCIFPLLTAW